MGAGFGRNVQPGIADSRAHLTRSQRLSVFLTSFREDLVGIRLLLLQLLVLSLQSALSLGYFLY
jgi:hypothetical protein